MLVETMMKCTRMLATQMGRQLLPIRRFWWWRQFEMIPFHMRPSLDIHVFFSVRVLSTWRKIYSASHPPTHHSPQCGVHWSGSPTAIPVASGLGNLTSCRSALTEDLVSIVWGCNMAERFNVIVMSALMMMLLRTIWKSLSLSLFANTLLAFHSHFLQTLRSQFLSYQ